MFKLLKTRLYPVLMQTAAAWILFTVLSAAPAGAATAEKPVFASAAEMNQWMTYYYQHPEPDKLTAVVFYMKETGLLDRDTSRLPLMAFIAEIFRQNPGRVEAWLQEWAALRTERAYFWRSLWYSGLEERKEIFARISEKIPAGTEEKSELAMLANEAPAPLDKVLISSPLVLDMIWASFMASGNEAMVRRVIEAAQYASEPKSQPDLMTGMAARFALSNFAAKHEKVRAVIEEELRTASGEKEKILRSVLLQAENPPVSE